MEWVPVWLAAERTGTREGTIYTRISRGRVLVQRMKRENGKPARVLVAMKNGEIVASSTLANV